MCLLGEPNQARRRVPKWLMPAFGYTISAVCLYWTLRNTSFSQSAKHIETINWFLVIVAFAFEIAANVCHGWRWKIILSPAEQVPLGRSVQAVVISLFVSEVLPAKAGEVVRGYLMTHWTNVHLPLTITSMIVEAVIDGIWLIAVYAAVVTGMQNLPHFLTRGVWGLGVAVVILSALLSYLLFHKQHSHRMISGHSWASKFLHLLDELHKMGQVRTLAAGLGVSFLYLLFQILSIWALLHADQYDFDIRQAGLIVIVFRILTLVPSSPGNVGVLQWATFVGIRMAGGEQGAEFASVNFAFITLARLIQGGVAILLTGINIGDIHRRAHQAHDTRMRPRQVEH